MLNFAFRGTLEIHVHSIQGYDFWYTFPDVGLAQGHSGSTNNWWFAMGGDDVFEDADLHNTLEIGVNVENSSYRLEFTRGGDGSPVDMIYVRTSTYCPCWF